MADPEPALVADHREQRKIVSALFAHRCTADACPLFMGTIVALD